MIDEEATEGAPLKNPLEEGMPDVRRKMWMLLPAVGIGVSSPFLRGMRWFWRRREGWGREEGEVGGGMKGDWMWEGEARKGDMRFKDES